MLRLSNTWLAVTTSCMRTVQRLLLVVFLASFRTALWMSSTILLSGRTSSNPRSLRLAHTYTAHSMIAEHIMVTMNPEHFIRPRRRRRRRYPQQQAMCGAPRLSHRQIQAWAAIRSKLVPLEEDM